MKSLDLTKKTPAELRKFLEERREALQQLRFDLVAGKVKNVREIRKTRKTIARILTLIKQK